MAEATQQRARDADGERDAPGVAQRRQRRHDPPAEVASERRARRDDV